MTQLRAKPPEPAKKRLKLFIYSPSGVGKTTAAIQFPDAYIIDAERGTENYDKLINAARSVVLYTVDMREVIQEVKTLLSVEHPYRTLVIDPISTLFSDLLDRSEAKVGHERGRHYGEAGKVMKRFVNLLAALDMNVVVTSHAKVEYGDKMQKLGVTYDAWKGIDYFFDLGFELYKTVSGKRLARTIKTRCPEQFKDGSEFEWSYQEVVTRWGRDLIERTAAAVPFATADQVREIKELLALVRLPPDTVDKWFAKAGVDLWEDMPGDVVQKCIEYVKGKLPGNNR